MYFTEHRRKWINITKKTKKTIPVSSNRFSFIICWVLICKWIERAFAFSVTEGSWWHIQFGRKREFTVWWPQARTRLYLFKITGLISDHRWHEIRPREHWPSTWSCAWVGFLLSVLYAFLPHFSLVYCNILPTVKEKRKMSRSSRVEQELAAARRMPFQSPGARLPASAEHIASLPKSCLWGQEAQDG